MTDELLSLVEVCREYFGLTERIALRKASLGLLPIPAFRVSGTKRGPLYVRKADLDAHVKRQYDKAAQVNSAMLRAGLV